MGRRGGEVEGLFEVRRMCEEEILRNVLSEGRDNEILGVGMVGGEEGEFGWYRGGREGVEDVRKGWNELDMIRF